MAPVPDVAPELRTLRYMMVRDASAAGPLPDGAQGEVVAWRVYDGLTARSSTSLPPMLGVVWLAWDASSGTWFGPFVGDDWEGRATGRQEAMRSATEACLDATGWRAPVRSFVPASPERKARSWGRSLERLGMVIEQRDAAGTHYVLHPAAIPGEEGVRDILIGLSGGGLRAAGFGIGALSLLHDTGVLAAVRSITSVSGGSIASGAWLASLARGEDFPTFLSGFERYLRGEGPAGRSKRGPLILQVADTLASGVLRGADGPLTLGEVSGQARLPEVVFQATEMTRGGSFVLVAKPPTSRAKHGTDGLRIDDALAGKLRLADAVASSAAFPVGFEPVRFPADFVVRDPETKRALAALAGGPGWPDPRGTLLVDGGVYDNQGIHGLKNAWGRYGDDTDVVLVVDADQTDPARAALTQGAPLPAGAGWLLSGLVGGVLAWGIAFHRMLLAAGLAFGLALLWALVQVAVMVIPFRMLPAGVRGWWVALPHNLVPALVVRGRVAAVLLMDVFMRRVRRLAYDTIYGVPIPEYVVRGMASIARLPERGAGHGMPVADKQRTEDDAMRWRYPASVALVAQGRVAFHVGTVLRLPEPGVQAEALLRAGRATAALALLKRVQLLPRVRRPALRSWLERMEKVWQLEFRS